MADQIEMNGSDGSGGERSGRGDPGAVGEGGVELRVQPAGDGEGEGARPYLCVARERNDPSRGRGFTSWDSPKITAARFSDLQWDKIWDE